MTRKRRRAVAAAAALTASGVIAAGATLAATGGSSGAASAGRSATSPTFEEVQEAEDQMLRFSTRGWQTDFSNALVPLSEFQSGGPGKDGIPAIDAPSFTTVDKADANIDAREPVIVLDIDGDVRVYPIQILIWHEIVNDTVGGTPVAVTFCPLCNTALVFERALDGQFLDFGTTGNLRNNDLVMFDRQTETWWQQFGGEALVGELAGAKLAQVPATMIAWEAAVAEHPDAQVLSRDTGFNRPYGANPYIGYDDVDSPPFFEIQGETDDRLDPKERVVFIERGEAAIAVPFTALEAAGSLEVEVSGEQLEVVFVEGVASSLDDATIAQGREVGSAEVRNPETGELVNFDTPFWFAVGAFRPDIEIVRG